MPRHVLMSIERSCGLITDYTNQGVSGTTLTDPRFMFMMTTTKK